MATKKKKSSSKKGKSNGKRGKGLSAKSFKGLSKKRMKQKGSVGVSLWLKAGAIVPVQFLTDPEDMLEYDQHIWQVGKTWNFVPCSGDGCPLCEDDDDDISGTSYGFACNVYNLKDKKVQVLTGSKTLAQLIWYRYERKPARFTKRVFELTRFEGSPAQFDVSPGDEAPVQIAKFKKQLHNLDDYLDSEIQRYFGDEAPTATALDDDDEDEDTDDDDFDEDEDDNDEDEDSDDEDDDDEDDEDEEDDEDDEFDEDDDEDEEDEPIKKPKRKAKPKPKKKGKPKRK